jgi:hypothetical protein
MPTGGSGSFSYQWQQYINGVYSDIPGADKVTYTPPALTTNTQYRLKAHSTMCGDTYSDPVTVTVNSPFIAGTIGPDQTVCYNTIPSQTLGGSNPTGGNTSNGSSGTYTYQWQFSTDITNENNWQNCTGSGVNSPSYYIQNPLTTTTWYRRAATAGTCGAVYSNSIKITVNQPLTEGTLSASQTICYNTSANQLTVSSPSGGTGSYTYQWQSSSPDQYSWQDIQGVAASAYTPSNVKANTYYRRHIFSGSCTDAYSNSILITVQGQLSEGKISHNQNIPYNTPPSNITCSSPTGGNGVYTFGWQSSTDTTENYTDLSANGASFTPGNLATTTYFRRSATSASCGTAYSAWMTVTVYGPFLPGVIGSSQIICNNATPHQLVGTSPSGGTGSYTYQWQNSTDGMTFFDILDITATGIYYQPPTLSTKTWYRRAATSGVNGTTYSNSVTITVNAPVTEGTLSAPQTICNGATPNQLNVTSPAGGTGTYTYQWQSSPDPYSWADLQGVTTSFYEPDALTTSTYYRRHVFSGTCGDAYSNSVKITVQAPIVEGAISPNQTVCYNSVPSRISVSNPSGGTGTYTYGWQWSLDNFYFTDIVGAYAPTYVPNALTQTTYFRRFANSGTCGQAYSDAVKITVLPQVQAGIALYDQTKCYGSAPDPIITTAPSGGNGSDSYTYQWQKSTSVIPWGDIPGAQTNSYQAPALTATTFYRVRVTSGVCGSAYSNSVTATITNPLTEGTLSQAQTICYGYIPNPLTVSIPQGGIPSEYTYQWQSSIDNGNWNDINGANNVSYSPGSLKTNTYFRRKLSTTSCGTVYTNSIQITVLGELTEGTITNDQTICYNTIPARINVTNPSGGTGTYGYGWESSTDGYTWNLINGALAVSYVPPVLTATTFYRRVVHSGSCGVAYSGMVTINVLPKIQAGTIVYDQKICYGTVPDDLSSFGPSGGTGTYSYIWQRSIDKKVFTNITGAQSETYTPPALTATTYYRLQVSSGTCGFAFSDTITISVPGQLADGLVSSNQTICFNSSPELLTGTIAIGGVGDYTYFWQTSKDNLTWIDIPLAKSSTYQPGILLADTFFRRVVTSGTCGQAYSNSVKITVNKTVDAGAIANSQQICYNNSPAIFTGSTPSGGGGAYAYQWQNSADSIVFHSIPNATSTTFQEGQLTKTTFYRRIVITATCGRDTTNIISVKVLTQLTAGQITNNQSVCNGAIPQELSGTSPTGGNGQFGYQWQKSSDNSLFVNVDDATNSSYIPVAATANIYYRRMVSSANCSQTPSNSISISVLPAINPSQVTQNQSICYNTQPTMLSGGVASGGMGAYSYKWQISPNDTVWSDIPGETSLTYSPAVLTKTTYFHRVTTSGTCGSMPSNLVTISVYNKLTGGAVKGDQTICYNSTPNLLSDSIAPSGGAGNYSYQWQTSVNRNVWTPIAQSNSPDLLPGIMTQSGYFRRVTNETCGSVPSNTIAVNVLPSLQGGQITGAQSICFGMLPQPLYGSAALGADGLYTYQWQYSLDSLSWTNLFFNGTSLNYSPDSSQHTTFYRRMATSTTCKIDSASNIVKVKVSGTATSGAIQADQTICFGAKPNRITGIPATGGTGSYRYQWQSSFDGSNWNSIFFFADSVNYSPSNLMDTTVYRRKVSMPGCKDLYSNSVVITVNSEVANPVVSVDSTYCINTLVNLTETSANKNALAWYDSDQKLIGQGKTYTIDKFEKDTKLFVQAIRSDNCTSEQLPLLLKLDKIHASFSTDLTELWEGNAVHFTNLSFGGKKYIWQFYDGDPSYEVNPWHFYNSPGDYNVQLIAISPSNCSDTMFVSKIVTAFSNPSTGVATIDGKVVTVWPNPFTDFINIQGSGETIQQVTITDMQGKTLINKEVMGFENMKVNVSYLACGMYTLKVKSNKNWFTFKIVKQ